MLGLWCLTSLSTIISVIPWRQVLLVAKTEENRHGASRRQTLSNNVVLSTPRHERDSYSQR